MGTQNYEVSPGGLQTRRCHATPSETSAQDNTARICAIQPGENVLNYCRLLTLKHVASDLLYGIRFRLCVSDMTMTVLNYVPLHKYEQ